MSRLRVVAIVSNDKSDLYFANYLMNKVNIVGVIVENQREAECVSVFFNKILKYLGKPRILINKVYNRIINKLINKYADYHKCKNAIDFGQEGVKLIPSAGCAVFYTKGVKDINEQKNIEWIKNIQPDVIAVCGASILQERILAIPKYGVLNLHGGLSQKYRGILTTDWAVHNEEPEYIGATVHFVSPGIDTGDIVYQGRPKIELDDNPRSLYVKVVKLGVEMMIRAICDLEEGRINASPLQKKGDLYLARMYDAKARARTWKNVKKGVIKEYLTNKAARDKLVMEMMTNIFPWSH